MGMRVHIPEYDEALNYSLVKYTPKLELNIYFNCTTLGHVDYAPS
jgi:hypothetical protein